MVLVVAFLELAEGEVDLALVVEFLRGGQRVRVRALQEVLVDWGLGPVDGWDLVVLGTSPLFALERSFTRLGLADLGDAAPHADVVQLAMAGPQLVKDLPFELRVEALLLERGRLLVDEVALGDSLRLGQHAGVLL